MPIRRSKRCSVEQARSQGKKTMAVLVAGRTIFCTNGQGWPRSLASRGMTQVAANGNLNAPCLWIGSKFLPKLETAGAVASVFGGKNLCQKADRMVVTVGVAAT